VGRKQKNRKQKKVQVQTEKITSFNLKSAICNLNLGVPLREKLRVVLYVPAFFLFNCLGFKPEAIEKKKELHCHHSRGLITYSGNL
jgi:hypothetical protein